VPERLLKEERFAQILGKDNLSRVVPSIVIE